MGAEEQNNKGAQEPQSNGEGNEITSLDEILTSDDGYEEDFDDQDEEDFDDDEGLEEDEGDEGDDQDDEEDEGEEDGDEEEDDEEEDDEDSEEEEEEDAGLPEWTASVREAFPDREFNSMEDFDQANTELHTQKDEQIRQFQETENQIKERLNSDPEYVNFFKAIMNGVPLRAAIIQAGISGEDLERIQEGDEDSEAVVRAKIEREQRIQNTQKEQERRAQNQRKSDEAISNFQRTMKLPDKDFKEFMQWCSDSVSDIVDMNVNSNLLTKMYQGFIYDTEIQRAEDRGRIRGRNEKIAVEKKKKTGDQIPRLKSSQTKKESAKKEPQYEDDWTKMMDGVLKDA